MRTLPILFVALLLLGTAENLRAQERIIITGTLRDAATSRPVESANVLLQDTARRAVYNYAITGDNGVYRLEYRGDADSVAVRDSTSMKRCVPSRHGRSGWISQSGKTRPKSAR